MQLKTGPYHKPSCATQLEVEEESSHSNLSPILVEKSSGNGPDPAAAPEEAQQGRLPPHSTLTDVLTFASAPSGAPLCQNSTPRFLCPARYLSRPPLSPIFLQALLSPSPPPLHFLHHSALPLLSTFAVVHLNMPAGIHKLKHHVISIAMGHLTGRKVQLHEGGEIWLHTHFISGQRFKETTPFPPSPRRRRKRAPLRGGGLHNGPWDVTVARASLTRSRERCRFAPLF